MSDLDEIELVLLIGNTNPETIIKLLEQNGYKVQEGDKVLKEYKYFDTPDRQFYHSGESLRVRFKKEGKENHRITYKVPNEHNSDEEYMNRKEYNVSFEGEARLENALRNFKKKYPNVVLPENLKHMVNVDKLRTTYNLTDCDGNTALLDFDEVLAVDPSNPENQRKLAREMEVEINSIPVNKLKEIMRIITEFDPSIRPSKVSKYNSALDVVDDMRETYE